MKSGVKRKVQGWQDLNNVIKHYCPSGLNT
jgi:hypothetical protein